MNKTSETLLAALRKAEHRREPFDYWLLEDMLPDAVCDGIAALPFAPAEDAIFDGRRKSNNSKRVYFTPTNQQRFTGREVADAFYSSRVVQALERVTGAALTTGRLRIEYCQDVDGFWLEPQVGIPVKRLTMRVYLMDAPDMTAVPSTSWWRACLTSETRGSSSFPAKTPGTAFVSGPSAACAS